MYDYNITAQELSGYNAEMLEQSGINYIPTEEEMGQIYAGAQAQGWA